MSYDHCCGLQEHFQVPERPWVDVGIGLSYEADLQNLAAQACLDPF